MRGLTRRLLEQLNLTFHDHIEPIPAISLPEDDFVRLEVFSAQARALVQLELHDVGRQYQIEKPVGCHADLAIEPGQLHEVNGSP